MTTLSEQCGGPHILLVEDDVDALWLLAHACHVAGYETTQAVNGREALEALEEHAHPIILLDLNLPDMNGIDVLRAVHERNPRPYVIIVTASVSLESAIAALKLGAVDYISKPVATRDVLAAIRNALEQRASSCQRLVEMSGLGDELIGSQDGGKKINSDKRVRRFDTEGGTVIFEPEKQQVIIDERRVSLTPCETEVLEVLLRNLDEPLSPEEIAVSAWGETMKEVCPGNVIRPHIHRLRLKLEREPSTPRLIVTVHGKGYAIHSAKPLPDSQKSY